MSRVLGIMVVAALLHSPARAQTEPSSPSPTPSPEATDLTPTWLPPLAADQVDRTPDAGCRFQLAVELGLMGTDVKAAAVADHVDGPCEIWVEPRRRSYELTPVAEDCGTLIYQGVLPREGGGTSTLVVRDHSRRYCEDLRPFDLEIEEHQDRPGRVRRFGLNLRSETAP